jgi:hypothetical protein
VDTKKNVYVETNSVPASAVPLDLEDVLYCACANSLEVKGGGFKVEGLTLLPAGNLFYHLCKLTFGLQSGVKIKSTKDINRRIQMASKFHQSSMDLGERIECFPDKIRELICIFDGVDSYESLPWESLNENPFIGKYQNTTADDHANKQNDLPRKEKVQKKTSQTSSMKDNLKSRGEVSTILTPLDLSEKSFHPFSDILFERIQTPFRSDEINLPSTNICSIVVSEVRAKLFNQASQIKKLHDGDWEVCKVFIENEIWYIAKFLNGGLPYVYRKKTEKLPLWVQCTSPVKSRPSTIGDALSCVPKVFAQNVNGQVREFTINGDNILIFKTFALALQMEAAFWLERQFCSATKHWYDIIDTEKMVRQLVAEQKRQENLNHANLPQKKKKKKKKKLTDDDENSKTS